VPQPSLWLTLLLLGSCTLATLARAQETPAAPARALNASAVEDAIQQAVEEIRFAGRLRVGDHSVAALKVLPDLYEQRAFAPAWSSGTDEQILRAVEAAIEDGLDPEDYHRGALRAMQRALRSPEARTPAALADYDLLLTDAVARRVYHLELGKVDARSLDPNWNLTREIDDLEPVELLQRIVAADSVEDAILAHRPQHRLYRRALAALARYRQIQGLGGWEPVPEGPKLEEGMRGSRIDGIVGEDTLAEMNVPIADRLDQIRVNLERGRWILHDLSGDYLLVDIAGFELRLFRDDEITWTTRVQVGRPYRKTPVFRSQIRYLDFNPTWTIPPGILRKDTLPAIKRDPSYLSDRNIRVIDRDGKEVIASTVDWTRYPESPFPYRLVQDPGPSNALGRVKFMFPNDHLVYLHDTPSRSLFERSERAFSSGCIRVEQPFELARVLLNDPEAWSDESIARVVESRETQTIFLPKRETVLLLYWTVDLLEEDRVGFKRDLYDRDGPLLEALAGDFALHPR
jgi:murein L,D-transpeptidase YcbB/YkuD